MGKGLYSVQDPPHVKAPETVSKIYWTFLASLLPTLLFSFFFFRWDALRILGCSISGGMLAELLGGKLFGRKNALHDGSTIFISVLFALMCAPKTPSWIAALFGFAGIFLAKEIFGGTGQYVFHPAACAQAMLHSLYGERTVSYMPDHQIDLLSWRSTFEAGGALYSRFELFLGFGPGMLGETCVPALMFGAWILILKKLIHWEIPLIYLGSLFIFSWLMKFDPWISLLSGSAVFTSCYLVTDPVTTPMSRRGVRSHAFVCALLVVGMRRWADYYYVLPFALLVANLLTPWIDAAMRPKRMAFAAS